MFSPLEITVVCGIIPPMGEAKQLETPRAQAAARISVLRDSFCKKDYNEQVLETHNVTKPTFPPGASRKIIIPDLSIANYS